MEEYHHEDKVTSRIHAGIAGWEEKIKIALHRREQKQTVVKEIKAHFEEKETKAIPVNSGEKKTN